MATGEKHFIMYYCLDVFRWRCVEVNDYLLTILHEVIQSPIHGSPSPLISHKSWHYTPTLVHVLRLWNTRIQLGFPPTQNRSLSLLSTLVAGFYISILNTTKSPKICAAFPWFCNGEMSFDEQLRASVTPRLMILVGPLVQELQIIIEVHLIVIQELIFSYNTSLCDMQ